MRQKTAFTYIFIVFLIFVTLGDKFLPGSLGKASANTRQEINSLVKRIFPQKEFKNPNQRTEDAVDDLREKQSF